MNSNAGPHRHDAKTWLISCVVAGIFAALPMPTAAMSLAAAHAPESATRIALVRPDAETEVAVSRSVGLMVGATGSVAQAQLGTPMVVVTRSVGLMEGAGGPETQAQLGSVPVEVTRSIGLMEGAPI